MTNRLPVLVIAGDIGGARAILPALAELDRRRAPFVIADHRTLAEEANGRWPRVTLPNDDGLPGHLKSHYSCCVFGTSVRDPLPLHVARIAESGGLPSIAVLDNWMSYRMRLETDGRLMLVPRAYAVMDELARTEAIADGVPASCLRVVGHPGLQGLSQEYDEHLATARASMPARVRVRVVFISEPAEKDQGADDSQPTFRGYTEKTVLSLLSENLQAFHERVEVALVPHPRENAEDLERHWVQCRGKLIGGLMQAPRGRDAVFQADAVSGMSSLLLFEGLLIGKPVLSLQPGLRVPHLDFLRKKGVRHFVTEAAAAPQAVRDWMADATTTPPKAVRHPELALHEHAVANLADLVTLHSGG